MTDKTVTMIREEEKFQYNFGFDSKSVRNIRCSEGNPSDRKESVNLFRTRIVNLTRTSFNLLRYVFDDDATVSVCRICYGSKEVSKKGRKRVNLNSGREKDSLIEYNVLQMEC